MTDESTAPAATDANPIRPEELPPVEPPSAGFIIQLFVVPALIVAAVIGVWALFGRLADSDTDWKQLVSDLGSTNEHRRWRSASHLAQLLGNEHHASKRDGADSAAGELLSENEDVASALCDLLDESLKSPSTLDEEIEHRKFLARTLGSLRCNEVVLPVLARTLAPERNIEVRKSGLMSVVMIAAREFEAAAKAAGGTTVIGGNNEEVLNLSAPLENPTVDNEAVFAGLKAASKEEDASMRHLAAYGFGLISGPESMKQLKYLIMDRDELTRANAAVGLARNGDSEAADALAQLLKEQMQAPDRSEFQSMSPEEQQAALEARNFVRPTVLRDCLRATANIYSKADESQQSTLKELVSKLTDDDDASVRLEATSVLEMIGR